MVVKLLNQEILKVILLNTKNCIIGVKDVFIGTLNNSIVHPREIFKTAINKSSASIIICHNHPSGDPTPSTADITTTKKLIEGASLIGIEVLDHVIIGLNSCFSILSNKKHTFKI